MSTFFKAKSPTRIDLSGGTLDLWPLYSILGGATTINLAIDIFTEAELEVLPVGQGLRFESKDLKKSFFFTNLDSALKCDDPDFLFYRVHLNYWKPPFGLVLKTKSDSPVGGGLGGSSSLTISLLKVMSQALYRPFASDHEMCHLAHNLEAQILLTPTGLQDYYPALYGGLNILDFKLDQINWRRIESFHQDFGDRLLLVYTGRSHHSGLNNFEVLQKVVAKDAPTIKALIALKEVSLELKHKIENGDLSGWGPLFQREYLNRLELASSFASPEIKELALIAKGAEGIKICGAGGGGCVFIWCQNKDQKDQIRSECEKKSYTVLAVKPVFKNVFS